MRAFDLTGKVVRVIEADDYRIILEVDDGSGMSTNKFVVILPRPIEGDDRLDIFDVHNLEIK